MNREKRYCCNTRVASVLCLYIVENNKKNFFIISVYKVDGAEGIIQGKGNNNKNILAKCLIFSLLTIVVGRTI